MGAVSPGPSFVMVARVAVSTSRTGGIAASMGMGLGGVVFALAALLGLHAVLVAVPALYAGLKVLGGLYLCYLGYRIVSAARQPLQIDSNNGSKHTSVYGSLLLGLTTQVSNPKTAVVYGSVFAAFLPRTYLGAIDIGPLCVEVPVEAAWYCIIAAHSCVCWRPPGVIFELDKNANKKTAGPR